MPQLGPGSQRWPVLCIGKVPEAHAWKPWSPARQGPEVGLCGVTGSPGLQPHQWINPWRDS